MVIGLEHGKLKDGSTSVKEKKQQHRNNAFENEKGKFYLTN